MPDTVAGGAAGADGGPEGAAPARYALLAVDVPFPQPVQYRWEADGPVPVGARCLVPWRDKEVVGLVVGESATPAIAPEKIRPAGAALDDVPRMSPEWLALTRFAADYYAVAWGQVAVAAMPKLLKCPPRARYGASLRRALAAPAKKAVKPSASPALNAEQKNAVESVCGRGGFSVTSLFGVTGSGKTEVYLACARRKLDEDPEAQVLLMVPEINLTPQLERLVRGRFPGEEVVSLNSSLPHAKRTAAWIAAAQGRARILLGTRMSVFFPAKKLSMIVVDEEHDASYRSREGGVRYSARSLAIKRAQLEGIPVVLGSATPALETWEKVLSGHFQVARLPRRAGSGAELPELRLVDQRRRTGAGALSPEAVEAVAETLEAGAQALVFLNRRGYAPALSCPSCGWVSGCPNCSVHSVFHKSIRRLVCHRCGWSRPVPERCPDCGNPDIRPVGQGTQRVEEEIAWRWPDARVLRIDADSTRGKDKAEAAFDKVHAGDVDILVGTQMVSKGHDFHDIKLVVVLGVDALLASPSYRATEELLAMLLQVSGRAGRQGSRGRVLIQTRFPEHPIFEAVARGDWEGYAAELLEERRAARVPPFAAQAMLHAEAREYAQAEAFLREAVAAAPAADDVRIFDIVPAGVPRVNGLELAQVLVEADGKPALRSFLRAWMPALWAKKKGGWFIEVDPTDL